MGWICFSLALSLLAPQASSAPGASRNALRGTWSGDWTPNGVWQSITIEISEDKPTVLTGKFVVQPSPVAFGKLSYDVKTNAIAIEAGDQESGTRYHLTGKVKGTEIVGTLTVGEISGEVRLIKWTFFGR
jgi:hypothetical protein